MTGLNTNEVKKTSMIVYAVVKQITTEKESLNVCIDDTYTEIELAKKRCDEINEKSHGDVFATWVMAYLIDEKREGEDYIHD